MRIARNKSEALLSTKYKINNDTIIELIEMHNEIREIYNNTSQKIIVQNIIFTKSARLLDGVYVLIKENLGQESGALLRPAIEGIELLDYIKMYPEAFEQLEQGKLPSAGERARKIDGKFKPLRDYLNKDASHFNISYTSMINLMTKENTIIYDDDINEEVLLENIKMITLFWQFLVYQGLMIDDETMSHYTSIIKKFELLRARIGNIYNINI